MNQKILNKLKKAGYKQNESDSLYDIHTWLAEEKGIHVFVLPTFSAGKCDYDSYKREGFIIEITRGHCNYLDSTRFNEYLRSEWEESNEMEELEEDKETWEEFLYRIGKRIYTTYNNAFEAGISKALSILLNLKQ